MSLFLLKRFQRYTRHGFSLVEVTLAMGIISFAILTVMALMPVGLSTMRSAMDQTTETQIIRQLGGEILLTPFSEIGPAYKDQQFFFGEDGRKTKRESARYRAVTSLLEASYPGSKEFTLVRPVTNSLMAVQVKLISPVEAGAVATTNVYTLSVPNSGG